MEGWTPEAWTGLVMETSSGPVELLIICSHKIIDFLLQSSGQSGIRQDTDTSSELGNIMEIFILGNILRRVDGLGGGKSSDRTTAQDFDPL